MILIYPSIEDYYFPGVARSRTFTLSSHSSYSSLRRLLNIREFLLGRPLPFGRPGRPGPFPTWTSESDYCSESSPSNSS